MADFDQDWERALLEDMRANNGVPTSGMLAGAPLLLLMHTGAKSGEPRETILTYSTEGNDRMVAGSAGGSPKPPAWLANLRANPDVTIEIGTTRIPVTAHIADEPERTRLWDQHVAQLPAFAGYPAQAGRDIPMIRLTPKDA